MKSFNEVINKNVIRWTEKETQCLALTNHVADDKNGVFQCGKLAIVVTTEYEEGAIIECMSISKPGKKPSAEDIEMVKNTFWKSEEIKDVTRIFVNSNVIHLQRKQAQTV